MELIDIRFNATSIPIPIVSRSVQDMTRIFVNRNSAKVPLSMDQEPETYWSRAPMDHVKTYMWCALLQRNR